MAITPKVRKLVTERDVRCRGCGSGASAHIHHIIFKSQGGADEPENLARLCVKCHQRAHALHEGEPIYSWELFMALAERGPYSVVALRRSGMDRCCGGCDLRTVEDRCLLWDQDVTWDYYCESFRRRNPRLGVKA
jgi:hypothetical protein